MSADRDHDPDFFRISTQYFIVRVEAPTPLPIGVVSEETCNGVSFTELKRRQLNEQPEQIPFTRYSPL